MKKTYLAVHFTKGSFFVNLLTKKLDVPKKAAEVAQKNEQ